MVSLAPNTVLAAPPFNMLALFIAAPPSKNVSCATIRCAVVPVGISSDVVELTIKFSVGANVMLDVVLSMFALVLILLCVTSTFCRYTLPVPAVLSSRLLLELVVVITLSSNCISVLRSIISKSTLFATLILSTLKLRTVKLFCISTFSCSKTCPEPLARKSKFELDTVVSTTFPLILISPTCKGLDIVNIPVVRAPLTT